MILRGTVLSKVLEMATGITIVVPDNFESESPYKVAYLLHGLWGNNSSWVDYTMLPAFSNKHNIIFIMPEVSRSLYTDMKHGQNFFTYITEELPVICKKVFNISAKREDTIVAGCSMGGYGALKCALSKPEQYGYCCAYASTPLFMKEGFEYQKKYENTEKLLSEFGEQLLQDLRSIFGEDLEYNPKNDIAELAKSVSISKEKPVIYSACGDKDEVFDENKRLAGYMKELGFDFTFEEFDGKHDWYFFNDALKRSLEFMENINETENQ